MPPEHPLSGYLVLRAAELEQDVTQRATQILLLESTLRSERAQHAAATGALEEVRRLLARLITPAP